MARAGLKKWVAGPVLAASLSSGCSLSAPSDDELMGGAGWQHSGSDASVDQDGAGGAKPDAPSDATADNNGDASKDGDAHVDVLDGVAPDVTCGPGEKYCGACVSVGDPAWGCTPTGCQPCAIPHAQSACNASNCTMVSCDSGWTDCNANPSDGCEVNLSQDPMNCATCGHVCPGGANVSCVNGQCGLACPTGQGDCDGVAANGCETDTTSTADHCGNCATACTYANASAQCIASQCSMGSCASGYGDCDQQDTNGCEISTDTDLGNCGSCGAPCPVNLPNATSTCAGGNCGVQCTSGWGDCDNAPANGCETDTSTSVLHCGGCNQPCPSGPNATPACANGTCSLTCTNSAYGDCDGVASNGCETILQNSAQHCGACGHSCLGTQCSAGTCEVTTIASGENSANAIAVDGSYVYWASYSALNVMTRRAPKTGGGAVTLENVTNASQGVGVALFGSDLYWTIQGTNERVLKDTTGTGTPATVLSANEQSPYGIATDGSWVFWTRSIAGGTIRRTTTAGGALTDIATNQASPRGIALDTTHAYWVNSGDGTIARAKKDGTDPSATVLVTGQSNPYYIAVDLTSMYWTDYGTGTVMKANLDGTAVTTLATGESGPRGLAIDATHVYWTTLSGGTIRKVVKGGGAIATLAQGQGSPRQIAVDATHVYWTNYVGDSVARVAK